VEAVSFDDVQMHHVKALKDSAKSKNVVHKHMIAVVKIPVCREHHIAIMGGNRANNKSKFFIETK